MYDERYTDAVKTLKMYGATKSTVNGALKLV